MQKFQLSGQGNHQQMTKKPHSKKNFLIKIVFCVIFFLQFSTLARSFLGENKTKTNKYFHRKRNKIMKDAVNNNFHHRRHFIVTGKDEARKKLRKKLVLEIRIHKK